MRYWNIAPWIAVLALPIAHAAEPSAAPPSAADAGARVPETKYESAFDGYQPFREQQPAPWRELNDEVHKAGGHIGILGGARGAHAIPAMPVIQRSPGQKK